MLFQKYNILVILKKFKRCFYTNDKSQTEIETWFFRFIFSKREEKDFKRARE